MVEVSAKGPEEVAFEKVAAHDFAAPLRLAGTYVIQASLEGAILPGRARSQHCPVSSLMRMPLLDQPQHSKAQDKRDKPAFVFTSGLPILSGLSATTQLVMLMWAQTKGG